MTPWSTVSTRGKWRVSLVGSSPTRAGQRPPAWAVLTAALFIALLSAIAFAPTDGGEISAGARLCAATFASLVFAVHPLRVESVAWITERRDVISGLFFLLTVLLYLRAAEHASAPSWRWWYGGSVLACALAM